MILKQYELKKKLDKEKKIFLFYGNNKGLIEETIETILKPSFSKIYTIMMKLKFYQI